MKAIVFAELGGPEVLALADVDRPDARPGMVLIKNHAIGVNFADTRFRQGTYAVKPKLPDTPGLEAAGVIDAVGDGVATLRPGARVAAFASKAYAEYCLAPASMIQTRQREMMDGSMGVIMRLLTETEPSLERSNTWAQKHREMLFAKVTSAIERAHEAWDQGGGGGGAAPR
jgi:NADPH:quinone reductase